MDVKLKPHSSIKTLTQLQEWAVESILSMTENGKYAAGYQLTFLNRRTRGIAAVRRHYLATAIKFGFTHEQAMTQWGDIKDYASLCAICED